MEKITSYKLTNGEIVHDESEAILKQKKLDLEDFIAKTERPYFDQGVAHESGLVDWILSIDDQVGFMQKLTQVFGGSNPTMENFIGKPCFFRMRSAKSWSTGVLSSILTNTEARKKKPAFAKVGDPERAYYECRPMIEIPTR